MYSTYTKRAKGLNFPPPFHVIDYGFFSPHFHFLLFLFLLHHDPEKKKAALPSTTPSKPSPPPPPCAGLEIEMREGIGGFDWLRCWDVILCEPKCEVCAWWVGMCVRKRGKGLGRCVILGLLHCKFICLYFIPHFGSDEPAPHFNCGWPSFTALCDSPSNNITYIF